MMIIDSKTVVLIYRREHSNEEAKHSRHMYNQSTDRQMLMGIKDEINIKGTSKLGKAVPVNVLMGTTIHQMI